MSFLDFNEDQYIKTVNTGESPLIGYFNTQENGELFAIRSLIYINDIAAMAGNEQIRLGIYSDEDCTLQMYLSSWTNIAEISLHDDTYGTTQGWYGFLAIYFNRENINKNINYYLKAEFNNYTRSGTRYLGLGHDYPFPVYGAAQSKFQDHPLAFQIYMYEGI
jgi:hypothetical protein